MSDYLSDFAFVLLIAGVSGLVLCFFGWLLEKFINTDKLVDKFQELIEDEDEDEE